MKRWLQIYHMHAACRCNGKSNTYEWDAWRKYIQSADYLQVLGRHCPWRKSGRGHNRKKAGGIIQLQLVWLQPCWQPLQEKAPCVESELRLSGICMCVCVPVSVCTLLPPPSQWVCIRLQACVSATLSLSVCLPWIVFNSLIQCRSGLCSLCPPSFLSFTASQCDPPVCVSRGMSAHSSPSTCSSLIYLTQAVWKACWCIELWLRKGTLSTDYYIHIFLPQAVTSRWYKATISLCDK